MAEVYLTDGNMIYVDDENEYGLLKQKMRSVARGDSPFVYLVNSGKYINVNYITYIKEV